MKKMIFVLLMACLSLMGLVGSAGAVGIDFTPITTAVDTSTLLIAIAAVAVLKFGPRFTKWAYATIVSMFGSK